MSGSDRYDVLIVGAGAAGLATAIAAAQTAPGLRIVLLDGARHIGAKILVSGGGRCNVTNRQVTVADYAGGPARTITRVLQAFPAGRTVEWFASLGVPLHEEERGKLFPDTNRARTVLDALLADVERRGIALHAGRRVTALAREGDHFAVGAGAERYTANRVVLATGGLSLPKTGSNGAGYAFATAFGHAMVQTTPALDPLLLEGDFHSRLTGVAHDVVLTCGSGRVRVRVEGPLLWTHFGVSGPAALDLSRHWHRARLESRAAAVSVSVCPGHTVDTIDRWLMARRDERPRAQVRTVLAGLLPAAVAAVWTHAAGISDDESMSHLTREQRRVLAHRLIEMPLRVHGSRGYNHAEVTAGGIALEEIDPRSMESRLCPGLYLVGEMLDVDGRLGGFNFQWAWASGWVAGQAIGRAARTGVAEDATP